ncbi:MAG: NADH-quinone oxidoreductase subunit J [Pseudomonadota bacterium]
MIAAFTFYMFATILTLSALMVITARNPVHSVLFLILAFFNAAGLFILLGAEFVAMILVIVYVGAVAVLFLFVVMMLDINFAELRKGALGYTPLGLILGAVLLSELVVLYGAWQAPALPASMPMAENVTNTAQIGLVLYTHYALAFQASGLILLVAMIGAIVLTLRERSGVRRQKVDAQVARTIDESMSVRQVPTGKGVSLDA